MKTNLTKQEVLDGMKISEIFIDLSEDAKNMVVAYVSALRDKELADKSRIKKH